VKKNNNPFAVAGRAPSRARAAAALAAEEDWKMGFFVKFYVRTPV
jgi:hypothetical protein